MSIANPYLQGGTPLEASQMRLRRGAAIASLSVAVTLIAVKFVAYMITDSVSLMTSLMDSVFDAVASGIMLLSIIHAATPADEEHRFGHGKIEALAALGQALFILCSGGYLLFESFHRFMHPQPVNAPHIGIAVMLLSIVLTGLLVAFQHHVIKKTQSVAISADHLHYKGDLFMNISVIAALGLSYISPWPYFDPLFAAAISLVLVYGARHISRESLGILMDQELPDAERVKIEKLVKTHPQVRAIHDLRTRHSGRQIFIEFHLELDGELTLTKAHDITEEIEKLVYEAFPQVEILIHPEPAGLDDHRLDDRITPKINHLTN